MKKYNALFVSSTNFNDCFIGRVSSNGNSSFIRDDRLTEEFVSARIKDTPEFINIVSGTPIQVGNYSVWLLSEHEYKTIMDKIDSYVFQY